VIPSLAVQQLTPETTVPDFWSARPEIAHIAAYAHARMCSRWAVLGVVLARITCTVPPNVVLPPIVGSDASLNLFVAVVGRSGSGKSASMEAAAAAVAAEGFPTVPLGSGEGISRSFAYKRMKDRELIWVERSVLFTATEIDALAAVSGRQGATVGPQMREMFNGGELGFGYAAPEKRVILPGHSYRASVVVGVQPGRAGALLDDEAGGTPQRFLWMPGTDATIPRYPEQAPDRFTPPRLRWPTPLQPIRVGGNEQEDDSPAESKGIGRREELWVDPIAVDAILGAAHARATGTGEALDGHALLVRLKVAAALAILAGNKMVREDDWALAGIVMAVSDATRTEMQQELMTARAALSERLGRAEGIKQATAEEIKGQQNRNRVLEQIMRKVNASAPSEQNWRRSTLRKSFPSRDRDLFDEVFPNLFLSEADLQGAMTDNFIDFAPEGDKGTGMSTPRRASQERA